MAKPAYDSTRMTDETLTVSEVAAQLRVQVETVRRWIRVGRIKALRLSAGGRAGYRIRQSEVTRFVDAADDTLYDRHIK